MLTPTTPVRKTKASRGTKALRRWVETSGRTQHAIAVELGITPAHFCNLLKGARRPSLVLAAKLARTAGVTLDDWATR